MRFVSAKRTHHDTPWGGVLATWADRHTLTHLVFVDDPVSPSPSVFLRPRLSQGVPETVPLRVCPEGTPFQRSVWQTLWGASSPLSYGDLARLLDREGASRAVAQALASNPIALLIPCHLVIRSDGEAGGYRWGEDRKAVLLSESQDSVRRTVLRSLGRDADVEPVWV